MTIMKIAFPIKEDKGLDSIVDEHFGVAKHFLILETNTNDYTVKPNPKLAEGDSSCKTSAIAKDDNVDAVITKCIGDGSQRNLAKSNIKVFQAQKDTISENLALLDKDELKIFHIFDICQNKKNKKDGGCGGHHH